MAAKLSPLLGQPVIVENKAGAGGSIGAAEIAKSAADGYTIGMGSVSTMGTNIVAYKNNKLDPNTQFTHHQPRVGTRHHYRQQNFPHQDYKSFIAALKANPGKFSYASSGAGGVGHLAMELFLVETGTDAQHIAYKGAGPAVTDVLAGNVPIMWDNLSSSLAQIKAGNFIPIGLAFPKRIPQLPNIADLRRAWIEKIMKPTPGLVWSVLRACQRDIVKKIYDASMQALKDPDTVKKLEENGAFVIGNTPEQFSDQVKREVTKWKRVVDARRFRWSSDLWINLCMWRGPDSGLSLCLLKVSHVSHPPGSPALSDRLARGDRVRNDVRARAIARASACTPAQGSDHQHVCAEAKPWVCANEAGPGDRRPRPAARVKFHPVQHRRRMPDDHRHGARQRRRISYRTDPRPALRFATALLSDRRDCWYRPGWGTTGTATWARYLVDVGIAHQIDTREMPKAGKAAISAS